MALNPVEINEYWIERGKHYAENDGYRLSKAFHREQGKLVNAWIRELNPNTVLELGCGFGRITKQIVDAVPASKILAVDISLDQIGKAPVRSASLKFSQADLFEWQSANSFPDFRLTVAVEVFLHLPEFLIRWIASKAALQGQLLHDFDPAVKPGDRTGEHCFAHDYPAIYHSLGLKFQARIEGPHGLMLVSRC